jgi:hypothetical protein
LFPRRHMATCISCCKTFKYPKKQRDLITENLTAWIKLLHQRWFSFAKFYSRSMCIGDVGFRWNCFDLIRCKLI